MKVLIIEDEHHAAVRIKSILTTIDPDTDVLEIIDSVKEAVMFLTKNQELDLIFMDIQLADGLSFSIFDQVEIEVPVIFTTAYHEYSIQAFKVNSIDYLLKPIDEEDLRGAIAKLERVKSIWTKSSLGFLKGLMKETEKKIYKERFLVKVRDKFTFLMSEEVSYFYSEDSFSFLVNDQGRSYILDTTLNQLEKELDPKEFFRINRGFILNVKSVQSIDTYFNSRLKLTVSPSFKADVIVSRDKVKAFKIWLGG